MMTSPASSITKAASKQTYYTIRFLADRERVDDAYRAYAYFRWVDDIVDVDSGSRSERRAFLERQKFLLESCYRGEKPRDTNIHEQMLVDLVQQDHEKNSGLQSYLRNMMAVIDFDSKRRGRLISQDELNEYTRLLSRAVSEAMYYFIGNGCYVPQDEARYLAVSAAHITHMLRDTLEDIQAGYFNIPREYLTANRIGPQDVESKPYRAWVQERVNLARAYFRSGKDYMAEVESMRCRIATYAYIARFEVILDVIERLDYRLAAKEPQVNGLRAGIKISRLVLSLAFFPSVRKSSAPLDPPHGGHEAATINLRRN
jgi:phytoene/squalene synthetase